MNQRKVILIAILAVALGVFLLDVHGNPRRLMDDLRETWSDLHNAKADTASAT